MTQVRNVIGQSVPRRGLAEKLTGECRYTADLKLPGMLHAKVLASPSSPCRHCVNKHVRSPEHSRASTPY